jgi:hypothetical protein
MMNKALLNFIISGTVVAISIVSNYIIALRLPSYEYSQFLSATALLPLASAVLSPLILSAGQVATSVRLRSRAAQTALLNLAAIAGLVSVFLLLLGNPNQSPFLIAALWTAAAGKASLDGVLASPKIVCLSPQDKIIRCLPPALTLLFVLQCDLSNRAGAIIALATAMGLGCLVGVIWAHRKLDTVTLKLDLIVKIYIKERSAIYLSLLSAGVFALPLFLFSSFNKNEEGISLGFVFLVLSGLVAFSTLALNRQMVMVASNITRKKNKYLVSLGEPATFATFCAISAIFAVAFLAHSKSVSNWGVVSISAGLLVSVEVIQGIITGILLRIGDRFVIRSAALAASANTVAALYFTSASQFVLFISIMQFVSFAIPGFIRFQKINRKNGNHVKFTIFENDRILFKAL